MPKLVRYGATALSGLPVALFLAVSPALAEMEVLESSVPSLEPGTALADDATLNLPDGTKVRLLIKATGSTKTLKGPYEGTAAAYTEKRSWWQRLTGEGGDIEPPMGAVRGLRKPE